MVKRKMNAVTLSDEELQDMFEVSFEEQVASYNSIGEYEAKCVRVPAKATINMEVTIFGLAGTPIPADFKEVNIKNIDTVTIEREDKGSLKFTLVPKKTISLNTNDYIVVYKSS